MVDPQDESDEVHADDMLDDAISPKCEVVGPHPFNTVARYVVRNASLPNSKVAFLCETHGLRASSRLTEGLTITLL